MKPTNVLHLVNILGVGGAEGQFVERVRTTDRDRFRPLVAALQVSGRHVEALRAEGIEPVAFPLGPSFAHPTTAWIVARLAAWMRSRDVKLVHAQDFYTNLLAVPAARIAGAKVIVSRLDLAHWHGSARRLVLALATRAADRVQVNAMAITRQLVEEERIDPAKVALVNNGIDLARFDACADRPLDEPLPIPPGAKVITTIANLHPIKGQEDTVRALASLASAFPSLHLLLVGEGEKRKVIEDCARRLGVADRVHLLGHRADVPAILARSHVLVSSSRAEGLSNSVIEGMAARLPIVATAVGGTPELVDGRSRGMLVPARSPERIADAVARILSDPELARSLGREARRFAERNLGIEVMSRGFDRLYEEVLAPKGARARR
ncbi:MAG TPA: glycosyltransferase [Vulgatibacter sp.]|nr:glycosyltransferase [Vulgatibacter sp.]